MASYITGKKSAVYLVILIVWCPTIAKGITWDFLFDSDIYTQNWRSDDLAIRILKVQAEPGVRYFVGPAFNDLTEVDGPPSGWIDAVLNDTCNWMAATEGNKVWAQTVASESEWEIARMISWMESGTYTQDNLNTGEWESHTCLPPVCDVGSNVTSAILNLGLIVVVIAGGFIAFCVIKNGVRWLRY